MAYLNPFKLGIITAELNLSFIKPAFSFSHLDIIQEKRNAQGDYRKAIFKVNTPNFSIGGIKLSISDLNTFQSMKQRNALLNFKYRDDLTIIDEQNTSTDTLHVTLINTAATGITITGVWQLSDPAHAGTNYFTGGGTYDATTRIITLHSALPGANTAVLINYSYTGHGVIIKTLDSKAMQGQNSLFYEASMGLQSI